MACIIDCIMYNELSVQFWKGHKMRIHYSVEFDTFYQSEDGLKFTKIQLGKLQKDLLHFAYTYPGLHSYGGNRKAQVGRLADRGFLYHYPDTKQFKIIPCC